MSFTYHHATVEYLKSVLRNYNLFVIASFSSKGNFIMHEAQYYRINGSNNIEYFLESFFNIQSNWQMYCVTAE